MPILTGVPVEQANYVQGNPYSNTYNPGWKNHPNFSYKNNNALYAPGQAPATPPGYPKAIPNHPNNGPNTSNAPRKSNLEVMIEHHIAAQNQINNAQSQTNKEIQNQNIHINEQMKQLFNKLDALATHNKMLETQISQVAQQQAASAAPAGSFPGQPQPNPKGHANDVILRSGAEYDGPVDPRNNSPSMQQNPVKQSETKDKEEKENQRDIILPDHFHHSSRTHTQHHMHLSRLKLL